MLELGSAYAFILISCAIGFLYGVFNWSQVNLILTI